MRKYAELLAEPEVIIIIIIASRQLRIMSYILKYL